MKFNPEIHHRTSMRYPGYDYSLPGHYFITICVQDRECLFGEIENDEMKLSEIGKIALKKWFEIPLHFKHVILDEFMVMPNHVHGIIEITDKNRHFPVGVQNFEPVHSRIPDISNADCYINKFQKIIPGSLGSIVRGYKIVVTNAIKIFINDLESGSIWQRNFYDTIIETDEQLEIIRNYIRENPRIWNNDSNNPNNKKKRITGVDSL